MGGDFPSEWISVGEPSKVSIYRRASFQIVSQGGDYSIFLLGLALVYSGNQRHSSLVLPFYCFSFPLHRLDNAPRRHGFPCFTRSTESSP